MARVTFPERRQPVQTFRFVTVPFSFTLTVWIFAFHFRLVCLLECETLLPDV
jgi:preprotein translocase subunit SecE